MTNQRRLVGYYYQGLTPHPVYETAETPPVSVIRLFPKCLRCERVAIYRVTSNGQYVYLCEHHTDTEQKAICRSQERGGVVEGGEAA